jgi:hypothetical protein
MEPLLSRVLSAFTQPPPPESPVDELLKLRQAYAWEWFKYHATQRVMMFNYFLVVTGIMANAYVASLKEGLREVTVTLAVLGTLASMAFLLLDVRNAQLVDRGRKVLGELEKDQIFGRQSVGSEGALAGLVALDAAESRASIARHGTLLPFVEVLVIVAFLVGAAAPLLVWDTIKPKNAQSPALAPAGAVPSPVSPAPKAP